MSSGRRSDDEDQREAGYGDKVRVWWEPTDDKKRSDFSGAWWPAQVCSKHKNKYHVRYDNGDEEDVHAEHVSPLDTLPVDFGDEAVELAMGEFCEVSNDSKTDPCAWLGRIKRGLQNGAYLVEYPLHDSKPERIKPSRIRRARVMEDGEWRLIKPGQTWNDGDVTSPSELELIYEDTLQTVLDEVKPGAQPSASSKRSRGSAGPHAMGSGMVMDGMLSLFVTVDPLPGAHKFCFMPVPAGEPVPSGAIQVFFHQADVPQLSNVVSDDAPPAKRPVGRPPKAAASGGSAPSVPKPKTAEELYTEQFLKALHSTSDAPSPLTKSQAVKAAAHAWAGVEPGVKTKYEEMAQAVARKYQEQVDGARQ